MTMKREPKTEHIHILVRKTDYKLYQQLAFDLDISLSELIRRALSVFLCERRKGEPFDDGTMG